MFSLKLQHVLIVLIILEIALSTLLSVAILMTHCPGSTLFPCSLGMALKQLNRCRAGEGRGRRQETAEGDALGLCPCVLERVPRCA